MELRSIVRQSLPFPYFQLPYTSRYIKLPAPEFWVPAQDNKCMFYSICISLKTIVSTLINQSVYQYNKVMCLKV